VSVHSGSMRQESMRPPSRDQTELPQHEDSRGHQMAYMQQARRSRQSTTGPSDASHGPPGSERGSSQGADYPPEFVQLDSHGQATTLRRAPMRHQTPSSGSSVSSHDSRHRHHGNTHRHHPSVGGNLARRALTVLAEADFKPRGLGPRSSKVHAMEWIAGATDRPLTGQSRSSESSRRSSKGHHKR
jgi:hypothetical protein